MIRVIISLFNQVHSNHVNYSSISNEQGTSKEQEPAVMYVKYNNQIKEESSSQAMLATAIIYVGVVYGKLQPCRAVLDSGSQLNFISQASAKWLQLKYTNESISIAGIGSTSMRTTRLSPTIMSSRVEEYSVQIVFHSLSIIASSLPSQLINMKHLSIPNEVQPVLADPNFSKPGSVDCLLGANIFFDLFHGKQIAITEHLMAHSTKLGSVVTGKLFDSASNDQVLTVATSMCGSISQPSALSLYTTRATGQTQEELVAEEHFKDTVKRNETGRYVVRLPLKRDPAALGNSLEMAIKRFFNLELKFTKDDLLAKQYAGFMLEYLQLKHMKLVKNEDNTQGSYYLPHYAVIKEASRTTKTHVVFDTSATTTSNISLNDILLKGPTVQPTLFSTLLRFRLHKIALTADIEKMYRQILVDPQDCPLQTICYRSNPTEPLNKYQLCTVTYGMKSTTFLATRCLVELSNSAPSTSSQRAIRYDFYVDDLLSGANTDEECYICIKKFPIL